MEKDIWDYYMNLGGIAYDPFTRNGRMYIRAASLYSASEKAVLRVGVNCLKVISSTMEPETMARVRRDLPRNGRLLLNALIGRGNLRLRIRRSGLRRSNRAFPRRGKVARLRFRTDEERYSLTVRGMEV